jgi:hypothetical protein
MVSVEESLFRNAVVREGQEKPQGRAFYLLFFAHQRKVNKTDCSEL